MDSHQQQFCLKWNSFGSNLATAFSNLFKSESLTDVTLFCEGVTFKAHRLILAACSKHFQELFEGMPPSPAGLIVILDGTSAQNMAALLEFMYRGEVHVSQESLSSFLKAAECLQVKGLSIEHEKLAVAQRHAAESNGSPGNEANSSSTFHSSSASTASSTGGNHNNNNSSSNNNNPTTNGINNNNNGNSNGNNNNGTTTNTTTNTSSSASNNINNINNISSSSSSSNNSTTNNNNNNNNSSNNNNNNSNNNGINGSVSNASLSHQHSSSIAEAAETPDNGIARNLKRRTPTPAPPSPAPTYSLPNVYSTAHYYDSPQKRLMRSPSDMDSLGRASVLRDGAAFRPASAPHPLLLDNHLYGSFSQHHPGETPPQHPHTAPHTPTELERELERERSEERERNGETKETVAEDLRIKQEPLGMNEHEGQSASRVDKLAERLSGELYSSSRPGNFDSGNYANSTELCEQREREHTNGRAIAMVMPSLPLVHPPTPDLSPAPAPALWNSKINKAGTVTTPDGKKLKCPYCERLYGYETNLRAHIRQRHQGIRVPCPFCTRTFTRNNTVRRHIAREHKPELSLEALQEANNPLPDGLQQ